MAKKPTYKKLDAETLKEITNFIIERLRKEEASADKARYDKRLANVKLLLRNFRSLTAHCESSIYDAAQVGDDISLQDILDMMNGRTSFHVESIRQSVARTRIILDHVTEMISMYRIYCQLSGKPEDHRRYRVIYWLYLADEPKDASVIASEEYIDKRTVYRDVDVAVEKLTALIFGVDGLNTLNKQD